MFEIIFVSKGYHPDIMFCKLGSQTIFRVPQPLTLHESIPQWNSCAAILQVLDQIIFTGFMLTKRLRTRREHTCKQDRSKP